jgi:cysteinyl-tRNA synthetase
MAGEKMSKSLGNVVSIPALTERYRPQELRYYLVAPHYRSTIEFSTAALDESVRAYQRLESFVQRVGARVGVVAAGAPVGPEFTAALDDDLGTPAALAVVHNTVRQGFTALDGGDDEVALAAAGTVRAQLAVLGLDPLTWPTSTVDTAAMDALGALVSDLLEQRQQARAAKDFATADAARDRLLAAGITVEDTPDGPQWTLRDS